MSKRFADASAYPLQWPDNFPRTRRPERSRFDTTLAKALDNVQDSLAKFSKDSGKKIENLVISSNVTLGQMRPGDCGVAVYFAWDGETTCIPVDRYDHVECNLQAIHHCIEAERTKLRHGGINLVKAAFRGYAALPHQPGHNWWEVFEVPQDASEESVTQAYKTARNKAHPDKPGGTAEKFNQVQAAFESFKKERQR